MSTERKSVTDIATSWSSVLLAIGAGVLAAFQVGKVHIALPSIRHSFALSLVSASWLLSALSVVGLFTATVAGSYAGKIGTKKTLILGLLLIAAASAAGAYSPTSAWLVWSRLLEGIGFVVIVVAAPSLIIELTSLADIRLALAGWSCFMPGGIALITLLAPLLLARHTWRALWLVNAVVLLLYAGLLRAAVPRPRVTPVAKQVHPLAEFRAVATARGPMFLAIIFAMYTTQHLAIMGFMPSLLMEKFGVSQSRAGLLVSVAMASNILGNLAAGVLLQRGIRRSVLIGATSVFMAVMTLCMFSLGLSLLPVYLCAFFFSCFGGIVPSCVMGAAPFHAPSEQLIPATNGLLVQGSNLGIVLGPPLVSGLAASLGWQWVPAMTLPAALIATLLAVRVSNQGHASTPALSRVTP
jgi:MFS family permease